MPAMLIAIIAGVTAGAYGALPAWVLGGASVAAISAGFAVAAGTPTLPAIGGLALAVLIYDLALLGGLLILSRASRPTRQ